MQNISVSKIKILLGVRDPNTHKGDYGKVLLVAGSIGMAGAAILAGRGAYSSGAGLVTCAVPAQLFPILQIALPEAICIPRKPGKIDYSQYDAIILGPGLGISRDTAALLEEILKSYVGPLVIDADGLNCIGQYDLYQALLDTKAQVVLTPHPGEAKRLLGVTEFEDREAFAVSLSHTFRSIAVLKGSGTLIAGLQPDGKITVLKNTTGNPGMATAGSGDVLAGIIGAFLAKGLAPIDAACAGVYIHGAAGDLAASEMGENGLMASDICRNIPLAIKNITGK
jgi:NAD(P)H-hydrate epimerase